MDNRFRVRVRYSIRNKVCGQRPCHQAVHNGGAVGRLSSVLASRLSVSWPLQKFLQVTCTLLQLFLQYSEQI